MGNKVVVALLSVVVVLLAAVLVIGALFLTRDTRSKATQLVEAQYDRCVTRVEEEISDSVGVSETPQVTTHLARFGRGCQKIAKKLSLQPPPIPLLDKEIR